MSCEQVSKLLQQYSEDLLDVSQQQHVDAHLESCASCRHDMRAARLQQQRYMRVVQSLPVPEPAPGKLAHLLKQATERPPREPEQRGVKALRFWQLATAAALLLAVMMSPARLFKPVASEPLQREVSVAIDVPTAMEQVALALDFPDELRWQGLEDRRRVAWTVDLKSGRNILTLPLVIAEQGPTQSTITATVAYRDGLRQFQLPVWLGEGSTARTQPVSL